MKRKEAVKEIQDILCDYYEGVTDNILTEERDKLIGTEGFAEDILYRLERVGMTPPPITNPDLKGKYSCFLEFIQESNYVNCLDYGKKYHVYRWEHE